MCVHVEKVGDEEVGKDILTSAMPPISPNMARIVSLNTSTMLSGKYYKLHLTRCGNKIQRD